MRVDVCLVLLGLRGSWPDRRRFLKSALATAGATTVAGCSIRLGDSEVELDLGSAETTESERTSAGTPGDSAETTGESPDDVPRSLSGVRASATDPLHHYGFDTVTSPLLDDHGADLELYVNGQTVPEILGRPLTVLSNPRSEEPYEHRVTTDWVSDLRDLGVPIQMEELDIESLVHRVFTQEDFDVYEASWSGLDPLGSGLPGLFHSDNADDHSEGNDSVLMNNSTGYGLFDYASADDVLDGFETVMEPGRKREVAATAMEAIYLDCPVYVTHVERLPVPLNTTEWTGS